jgi:hypothetical protein
LVEVEVDELAAEVLLCLFCCAAHRPNYGPNSENKKISPKDEKDSGGDC